VVRIALALVAVAGCGERLAPQSEVTKLRVLAIRADHPEASPGDVVNVTALWADPEGDGRDVGFVWASCTIGPGTDPRTCTQAGAEAAPIDFGVGPDHAYTDLTIPADALDGVDEAVVLVTLVVCAGGIPDLVASQEAGEVVCPEGDPIIAYKRITVTAGDAPNQNPGVAETLFSGSPWSDRGLPQVPVCPSGDCAGYALELTAAEDAAETYVGETPDGPAEMREELLVSFFSTGGEFDRVRAVDDANASFLAAWRAPKEPGDVTVWFVLRDGRGGITWAERTVSITP